MGSGLHAREQIAEICSHFNNAQLDLARDRSALTWSSDRLLRTALAEIFERKPTRFAYDAS